MPTIITVTQTNGQSLLIATADLVFATDNGSGSTLTQENNQTNPRQIQVTESLNDIVALDDSFLTVTQTNGASILLAGLRIKTVEDLTTFRRISYEGVGLVNRQFDVTDTSVAIKAAINSASSAAGTWSKIASFSNFDMAGLPGVTDINYEAGKDGTNILLLSIKGFKSDGTPYAGDNNELTRVTFMGGIYFTFDAAVSGWVFNSVGATSAPVGIPNLDVTNEKFQLEIINSMTGGAFPISGEIWALKSA